MQDDDSTGLQESSLSSPFAASDDLVAGQMGVIMPSQASIPTFNRQSALTPLVCDERAISKLLETLLSRSGLSVAEASRRMGVTTNTIRQYIHGRRSKPSLLWFIKLAAICGVQVTIEWGPGAK